MSTSKPTCDRFNYYHHSNGTLIIQGFEGIPQNLAVNVCSWAVLILFFTFLRKKAWDYGRIALVSRNEERLPLNGESRYNVWTALFYGDKESPPMDTGSQESLDTTIRLQDKGLCSWIFAYFKIKDSDIKRKAGTDAIQYLSFQRYLIFFTFVIMLLCLIVVLPINLHGDLKSSNAQLFGTTTLSNISEHSPTLWVPGLLAIVFPILAVALMRHFSSSLKFEIDEQASRTLMISGIPPEKCFKNLIMQHFSEAYPEAEIQDVQFAYNIRHLIQLDRQRQDAAEALRSSEQFLQKHNKRPMMVPFTCGKMCCCCGSCGCKEVDAIDYYRAENERLNVEVEQEKLNAFHDKVGIAFVTFRQDFQATRVLRDYRATCQTPVSPAVSSIGRELRAGHWSVKYAPHPDDINWDNLSLTPGYWWSKAILINLVVFSLVFFLTTPTYVLNLLNKLQLRDKLTAAHISPIIVQFIPSLILWGVSAVLPWCIYYSDYLIGHWTKSKEHLAVMIKTFTFLCLMVLILPSLGLTSIPAVLRWMFPPQKDAKADNNPIFRWECVFMPDNGAFFVNYVITAAFIGCAFELIRLPELLLYVIRIMMARSDAEKNAVRKYVLWEFQFGLSYAWNLCVFAVVCAYSILCPLITLFGLVYLLFKHAVDRYNIYFAYTPSRISKHIHVSAINCMIASVILVQLNVVAFFVIRLPMQHPLNIVSVTALLIVVMLYFGRIVFGWFRKLGPIKYRQVGDYAEMDPRFNRLREDFFVPQVLQQRRDDSPLDGDGQPGSEIAQETADLEAGGRANDSYTSGSQQPGNVNGYGSTDTT